MYLELLNNEQLDFSKELVAVRTSYEDIRSNMPYIVYQDINYSIKLKDVDMDTEVEILVNNTLVDGEKKYDIEKQEIQINFDIPIFQLIYGMTDITIMYIDDEREKYCYSPIFYVAIKEYYEETMKSVYNMLDSIYLQDHKLLQGSKNNAELEYGLKQSANHLEVEIQLIKEITYKMKKYAGAFFNTPKTIDISECDVANIEKMNKVSQDTVEFIVRHPEELKRTNVAQGIKIGNKYYLPNKTLISTMKKSQASYENIIVVSFINTLRTYVKSQVEKIKVEMESKSNMDLNKVNVKQGYKVSYLIIEQYLSFVYQKYYSSLCDLQGILQVMYEVYCEKLTVSSDVLHVMPKPTSTFLEVHHYRAVYQDINKWFSCQKATIPSKISVLQFYSADRIYEYYCLLNIVDVLHDLGFEENTTKRISYKYEIKNYEIFIDSCPYNTFYFKNSNGKNITLYYQPVIYSKKTNKLNEISLFKSSDSRKYPYYTPDFILKVKEKDDKEYYGVIDAKWRNQKSLKNYQGGMKDCIYKYYASVFESETLKSISFLWLLQGKDDDNKIYRYHRSSMATLVGRNLFDTVGIVPLTPNTGRGQLRAVLGKLL